MPQPQTISKILLSLLVAVPALLLLNGALTNTLGPDPADVVVDQTGEWTIRFLCLALAVTPLSKLTFLKPLKLLRYRRIIGVTTAVYASLHLLSFMAFILAWQWLEIATELVERPYITVGFVAFLILLLLAITSTDGWVRRLGRKWKKLHQWVYLAAVLSAIHLIWQIRSDAGEAIVYSSILAMLLLYRYIEKRRARQ
jgi:sulfoxide reductase heme-binding subunit YedZ